MTKALKDLPPEVVSQFFDNPPEELKDFTNNCACEDTGVLENKNRSVISNEVPADE